MRVLLLSRYGRLGSSSRVRMYQYLPGLEQRGFQFTVAPLLSDDYVARFYGGRRQNIAALVRAYLRRLALLLKCRSFDLLWVERELFPWLPAWAERWLAWRGAPYVLDLDDAVFHRYDQHPAGVVRSLLGGKIDAVLREAAWVVAGSPYLAGRAEIAGAENVAILPSVVDLDRYPARGTALQPAGSPLIVGWIGAPITAPYLHAVVPALEAFAAQYPSHVQLVGAGQLAMGNVPVVFRDWSEQTEVAELQQFDIGIMPVPDEPFERGKCGYKLIQYMACGLPVIASPVGANQTIVEHGVNGFLAETTDEWVGALQTLAQSPALRAKMGAAGRQKVETHYTLQATLPQLAALLHAAAL